MLGPIENWEEPIDPRDRPIYITENAAPHAYRPEHGGSGNSFLSICEDINKPELQVGKCHWYRNTVCDAYYVIMWGQQTTTQDVLIRCIICSL